MSLRPKLLGSMSDSNPEGDAGDGEGQSSSSDGMLVFYNGLEFSNCTFSFGKLLSETVPSRVVAVKSLKDVSVGPVVWKADRELREALERDGLVPLKEPGGRMKFVYDAAFIMGKRPNHLGLAPDILTRKFLDVGLVSP